MITVETPIFPNNALVLVAAALDGIDPDIDVIKRPLQNSDPQQSIGIFAQAWDPDEESVEFIGEGGPVRPTLQRYILGVQSFVKDYDEERGLAIHSVLAQRVRSVLYTHPTLKVALAQLSVTFEDGTVERLQRWGLRTARYFSGEIEAEKLFLATLEFWIETETH